MLNGEWISVFNSSEVSLYVRVYARLTALYLCANYSTGIRYCELRKIATHVRRHSWERRKYYLAADITKKNTPENGSVRLESTHY